MPKCVVGLPGGTDGPRPQIGREVVRSDSTWQCQGLPCAHGAVGCWARSCPLLVVPRLPGSSSLAVLWYPQALVAAGGTVALNCHLKQSTAWDSVHHTFAKRLGGAGGMAMAAGLCLVIMPSGGLAATAAGLPQVGSAQPSPCTRWTWLRFYKTGD